jgi:hypothetical protein
MGSFIYALQDNGLDECVKIGKNTEWPKRLVQARSHTPRGISTVALWPVSPDKLNLAEKRAVAGFSKRKSTPAREWYNCTSDDAIDRVTRNLEIEPIRRPTAPALPSYDDWRSLPDADGDNRKRLWVHLEDGPIARLKVIPSVLYDTAYRYTFTYNPYPVYLIAAYQSSSDSRFSRTTENARVWEVWKSVTNTLGARVLPEAIGWLDADVQFEQLDSLVRSFELTSYNLSAPKPRDAPLKDGSVQSIQYGALPPMKRVRPR